MAQHALTDAGLDVAGALEDDDLPRARQLLPALVGRDPSDLDVAEISRAVVESLAENTVDAVVAPALWGALLGAPRHPRVSSGQHHGRHGGLSQRAL